VRTHANYPWHRAALLRALELPDLADELAVRRVAAAVASLPAVVAQERIVAAGGVAAAVQSADAWLSGPVAGAASLRPLIEIEAIGDASARRLAPGPLPASGLRVLDLTRVIAGPVATRMLAALGADVLRVDPPSHPELPLHIADGLVGKRSTLLSADDLDGRRVLHSLIHEADVVVCGYRPGALDRLHMSPAAIAYDHPGTVLVTLSAWGSTGPWGRRRGFDSLVQAASGIAMLCSPDGVTPGALPCQLLDHATGYLAAAGALSALARQSVEGGTLGVWVSLARTAQWLLEAPRVLETPAIPGSEFLPNGLQSLGSLEVVPPPGGIDGVALTWPGGEPVYGGSSPEWLPT
jgi:hypothetical protein